MVFIKGRAAVYSLRKVTVGVASHGSHSVVVTQADVVMHSVSYSVQVSYSAMVVYDVVHVVSEYTEVSVQVSYLVTGTCVVISLVTQKVMG